MKQPDLREDTNLIDRFFPINVFTNVCRDKTVLWLHWHDGVEIIQMLEGRAVFKIEDRQYEAAPGDILVVNSGFLHYGEAAEDGPVVYQAIVFGRALLAGASPDPRHDRCIQPFLTGQRLFPEKIASGDGGYVEMSAALALLLQEFARKREGYELAVKAALQLFTLAAYRLSGLQDRTRRDFAANSERFKLLLEHIDRGYGSRITVEHAARIVALSPCHFCKTFKKLTGRTFVEFMNLYRVNKAAALLRETGLSVTEIAASTGFCNVNYFDKVFKQCKRCSPARYRKEAAQ